MPIDTSPTVTETRMLSLDYTEGTSARWGLTGERDTLAVEAITVLTVCGSLIAARDPQATDEWHTVTLSTPGEADLVWTVYDETEADLVEATLTGALGQPDTVRC